MRRWVAGLAIAAAVLGGCSTKQEANDTLPRATETSASPGLEPLGPADFPVPDEARKRTKEGVVAFATYYVSLSNHLLTSLDSAPLRDFSRGCETCEELAEGYDADKTSGYTYEGGSLSVTSTGDPLLDGSNAELAIVLHQDAVTVKDLSGAVVPEKSSDGYLLSGGIGLAWDDQRATWLVTQLDAERI